MATRKGARWGGKKEKLRRFFQLLFDREERRKQKGSEADESVRRGTEVDNFKIRESSE